MKGLFLVSTCFCYLLSAAQEVRTIIPQQPVIIGNAFQVQYIITDPSTFESIQPPLSDSIELISGPNIYNGNMLISGKMQPIRNVTFTLVAKFHGKVRVREVMAIFKNGQHRTTAGFINVLPQYKASFNTRSNYTDASLYAPSSKADLDKLISENLFVRTEVDKKTCYLGEPIVATFKLYSRLQSSSEVVNSPSLYGFSVLDILNIHEAHTAVELIGDRFFNTSILRKLQLFPEQTGRLVIDPMELDHEIEFDDSLNKGSKITIKRSFSTLPVEVSIKSLPAKKPTGYSGAVGQFSFSAMTDHNALKSGEQGRLTLKIYGKGNFIQLGPPQPEWPKGFDVFEPEITEELDKNKVPLDGWRSYVFPFVPNKEGSFVIPAIMFSYFDPQTDSFKTAMTDSIQIMVSGKKESVDIATLNQENDKGIKWFPILAAGLALLAGIMVIYYFFKKKKIKQEIVPVQQKKTLLQEIKNINKDNADSQQVCLQLHKILMDTRKEYGRFDMDLENEFRSLTDACLLLAYSSINRKDEIAVLLDKASDFAVKIEA